MGLKKKIIYGLSLLIFTTYANLSKASGTSSSTTTANAITISTEIKASLETVWKVIADFENYGIWNGWVKRIDGELKERSVVKAYDRASDLVIDLQITSLREPYTMCWKDVSWFTRFGVGGWRCRALEALPDGAGIRFTNHFQYTGPLRGVLRYWTQDFLVKGMSLENETLRSYVEEGITIDPNSGSEPRFVAPNSCEDPFVGISI